ncbi:MAG: hypothetical protein IJ736_07225 [Firmicutes bacterium]|nr:hypothetical protein [Bacillota bacterium]
MSLRSVTIGIGALSLMSFSLVGIDFEKKVYTQGKYYYGDNSTILNYRSMYESAYKETPSGFDYCVSPPEFNKIPLPKEDSERLKIGMFERNSFFTVSSGIGEDDYSAIKDKSSYTFAFENDEAVLSPTDLKVTTVFPNVKSGSFPSFEAFFTGNGVTVVLEGKKSLYLGDDSTMNEYDIRIKLTNLSKIWQSIGHNVSYKERATGRELFYTDFISANEYMFSPAVQVAVTGKTGSIAEIDNKNSYVTITLEKRLTDSSPWTSMTFGEFYGLK